MTFCYRLKNSASVRNLVMSILGSLAILVSFHAGTVQAAQRISVVALVNGEPITSFELQNRMVFLRAVSNLDISEDELRRDALQGLIGEKLKVQTAKDSVPALISKVRQPATEIIDNLFARDGQNGRDVLKSMNVPLATVTNKYVADILWGNILRNRFRRQFENIDNLAEQELEKLKQSQTEPQIKIREILLMPNPQRSIEQTRILAEKIINALNKGANFTNIATQYSEASTAQQGGRIDWMLFSRLPTIMQEALSKAQDGNIIGPLEYEGRIYIIQKDGFRQNGIYDPKADSVTLARAIVPLPANAAEDALTKTTDELVAATQDLNSCAEFETLNQQLGSGASSVIRDLQIGRLAPQLQKLIMPLQVGDKSPPLPFSEGMTIFMICARTSPDTALPDLDTLKRAELDKLFANVSGRYLLRLQRKAVIEFKDAE